MSTCEAAVFGLPAMSVVTPASTVTLHTSHSSINRLVQTMFHGLNGPIMHFNRVSINCEPERQPPCHWCKITGCGSKLKTKSQMPCSQQHAVCVVLQNWPHAVACWAAVSTDRLHVRQCSEETRKRSPDVSVLCRIINICRDGHHARVDIIHHVCPCRSRDVVQQQGVQLGYPPPIADCDGGVGVVGHQLRRSDSHLQDAFEM